MGRRREKRLLEPGPRPDRPWLAVLGAAVLAAWMFAVLKAHRSGLSLGPLLWEAAVALVPRPFPATSGAVLALAEHFLAAAWVLLAAWGAGWAAARPWRMSWKDPFEASALRFGLGLGVLSYAILGLGLAGLLRTTVLQAVLGGLSLLGLWQRRIGPTVPPEPAGLPASDGLGPGWKGVFACLLTAAAAAVLPFALAPEVFWDAMNYHLGLPHLYLLEGAMVPTPANIYSGNALAMQMVFAAGLGAGGPVAAKLVNAGMGLACALFFSSWARRWRVPGAGLVASGLFFLCPLVLFEFFRTSVGLGWAFLQLAAFHCVMRAAEEPDSSGFRGRWWALAGVFLGLAMSTKYPAWLLPGSLVLAAGLSRLRRMGLPDIRVREAGLALGIAVVLVSPWLIRNMAFYGDPAYPYFTKAYAPGGDGLCGSRPPGPSTACGLPPRDDKGWRSLNIDARARDVRGVFTSLAGLTRWLKHPWTFAVEAANVHADEMGPVFLMLLPLVLVRLWSPGPSRLLAALVLGAWLPLSLISEMPRFFMPQFAALSFLAASAVMSLRSGWVRGGLLAAVAASAGMTALLGLHPPPYAGEFWDVVSGRVSEERFLSRSIDTLSPGTPHPGVMFVNGSAPARARVLMVGDLRGLYLERPFFASSQFDVDILERLANCGGGPGAMRDRLEACGVSHILVNRAELQRLRLGFRFTVEGAAAFDAFWRDSTEKVFDDLAYPDHWVTVFRLLGKGERPDPAKAEAIF